MSALPRRADPLRALARPGGLAALTITAMAALLGVQAADGPWLAELGRAIASRGGIPDGVPYASAPSGGWPNVPALGELIFAAFAALGGRGLQVAQVAAVAGTLALLARDARRAGARERALAIALLLLVPACFGPFVAIRAQLFSLPLFAACALLLRDEARAPSRRIWLLVPLLAVWGNLHGAALTGAAVAGAYLLFERLRRQPAESVALMAACALALCANPALWRTPEYVLGVLRNEAARQAIGLWAPLSPSNWLDVGLALAAVALVAGAVRARPQVWELAALGGLALLTIHAARGGMWLALFAVPLAARGFGGLPRREGQPRLARPLALALLAAVLIGVAHGPLPSGASSTLLARTLTLAHGTPVLAEDLLAEQVAGAGGRVWIANPIDAFRRPDQRLYVDWLRGLPAGDAALAHAPRAVLVRLGSRAERRLRGDAGFRRVASDPRAVLYARAQEPVPKAG